MDDRYAPIGDYALLADCHSAALVCRDGSIDWACLRRFDGASAFGRLLDARRGGHFSVRPAAAHTSTRRYVGESLVLETAYDTDDGSARVLDAFAMRRGGGHAPYNQLLRVVEGTRGTVAFDVQIVPRFDYGLLTPLIATGDDEQAYTAVGGDTALVLSGCQHLDVDEESARLTGQVTVTAGQRLSFAVQSQQPHELHAVACPQHQISDRLDETVDWWARWSEQTVYDGPWSAQVRRSAVVLKGLTCAPTGAIVAAPTTSLPEELGGERNWDYRYCWVRDATLTLAAMSLLGHEEVARGFRDFIMRSAAGRAEDLQILYGVYGGRFVPETELDLDGYRGSRPVRIGNGATDQVQHDVYGHILDAAQHWRQTDHTIDEAEWRFLRRLVDRAAEVWRQPDKGLWEVRCEPRHFVASKVMLWVAMDRGVRTVEETGLDDVDLDRWRAVRDAIRDEVDAKGVADGGWFRQSYETDEVDAALLTLPLVGFCPATDPRMVATVERVQADLVVGGQGFIRRYRTEEVEHGDGLTGGEGVFLICSFWLVDVLALQGRADEAEALFTALLGASNDLDLFAEEYDPATGALLGNFPQAFTHLALITSAAQLQEVRERPHDPRPPVLALTERIRAGAAARQ